jgi:adhesin transport system membrane fusion protein
MSEDLFKTGDTSRVEVMRARRQVTELQGRLKAVTNKYLQDARQEAAKLADELSSSRYKLEEQKSVLDHTTLTAPVAGVVKYMKVTTIGGVLRAGDELMQISPSSGDMVVEVKVNPVDIGQLKVGLPAFVKLDAFDYSVYGNLQGTLSYISSDTLTEQGGNGQAVTYYRAHVRLDPQAVQANARLAALALKPGMTATVDLRTASRSLLQYLAKPIFKAFSGALNER